MASNLNALVRHLRKRPYFPKADSNFPTMRKAETKRRRKRIANLELVAAGLLQSSKATKQSGRIILAPPESVSNANGR